MTENKLFWVLQSRKFWMSAIGLILILVTAWNQDPYPTEAVVTAIMGVVGAFVAATAYEDSQHAQAQAKVDAAAVSAPPSPAVGIDANTVTVESAPKSPTVGLTGLE